MQGELASGQGSVAPSPLQRPVVGPAALHGKSRSALAASRLVSVSQMDEPQEVRCLPTA